MIVLLVVLLIGSTAVCMWLDGQNSDLKVENTDLSLRNKALNDLVKILEDENSALKVSKAKKVKVVRKNKPVTAKVAVKKPRPKKK